MIASPRLEKAALAQSLVDRMPGSGFLVVDCDLRIAVMGGDIYANYSGCVGRRVPDVIPAAAWLFLAPHYEAALDGHVQSFDYEAVGGASVHAVRIAPIRDSAEVIGVMVLTEDITSSVAMIKHLTESEDRLRAAHAVARLASWEWRAETDEMEIFEALPGDEALTGTKLPLEALLEQIAPDERQETREDLTAIARGDRDDTVRLSSRAGPNGPGWVETRSRAVRDDRGRVSCVRGTTQDVTERVAYERALLAGRNYMQAVADSIGEGLITLDTGGRVIYMNDAASDLLGWPSEALQGQVLHHVVHSHRPDGSEMPLEDRPAIQVRGDDHTVVDDDLFFRRDGRPLPVSYTASPFSTEDGVEGCVVVFAEISERKAYEEDLQREADKLAWIGRIQDALAQDRFVLHAQPIVDLASDEVVQAELLLRMKTPDGQLLGPGFFLPVAEQYGLIGDIDRWVITQGVAVAASGRPVEINLSAHSIGDEAVLDHIEACINDSGADPAGIVFEITETAIVADEAAASRFAERLRLLGCKLALDDFGTGYGGFTYLKQLPIDFLKIDIQFVRDLTTNPGSRHVVEAVVGLAKGFSLQTVAEGVEDADTYELLRELGVDFAQGYHIARPGPLTSTEPENTTPTGDASP